MVVVLWELQWVGNFVLLNQRLGVVEIPLWFPSVFHSAVSLPSDEEGPMTRSSSVADDCFYLIFFFSINKIQWQLEIVGTVFHGFFIRQEKRDMEDRVNFPSRRDVKMKSCAGDYFFYLKGASSFHLEFLRSAHLEVSGLKPDFISNLPRGEFRHYPLLHFLLSHFMGSLHVITGIRQA